jgi:hypothetical protein
LTVRAEARRASSINPMTRFASRRNHASEAQRCVSSGVSRLTSSRACLFYISQSLFGIVQTPSVFLMTAILADSVESFGDLSHTVWLFGCACQEVEPSRLNWEFSEFRGTRPESFFVMLVPCMCPACYNKSVSQRRRSSHSGKKVRPRSDFRSG